MTPDEISQAFEPWRTKHCRVAWKPLCDPHPSGSSNSWFGGNPASSSSDSWPCCSDCDKPMQSFLQLDLSELPTGFSAILNSGVVQLFYCSNDDGGCATWEPFSGAHDIRLVSDKTYELERPSKVEPLSKTIITDWQEFQDSPHPEEHEELGIEYDYDFANNRVSVKCSDPPIELEDMEIDLDVAETISLSQNGDKLGGWPYWVQSVEYPHCPQCGAQMDLLLQVDSDDNLPYMFGDVGCGHLTQCPNHPHVFAFGWACG